MPSPSYLSIPLSARGTKTAKPVVKPGDSVFMGQLIAGSRTSEDAENDRFDDIRIFSPISGTVTEICKKELFDRSVSECIVIKNNFEFSPAESIAALERPISELSSRELLRKIKGAGIPLNLKRGFPSYGRLFAENSGGKDRSRIKQLIIDCSECEPYVYSNHGAIISETSYVTGGIKILMALLGVRNATLAVTSETYDYYDVYAELRSLPEAKAPFISRIKPHKRNLFSVVKTRAKYPLSDERLMIYTVAAKEIDLNVDPVDCGYMVVNAGICRAIYLALAAGMPYTERIVTINGDCIRHPANLTVPLGASLEDVIEACGGFTKAPSKIVCSGLLGGRAISSLSVPVTHGLFSVTALSKSPAERKPRLKTTFQDDLPHSCIGCGKCVSVCPMHLLPFMLAKYAKEQKYEKCLKYSPLDCTSCGCCEYICPGRLPLRRYIKNAADFAKDDKARGANPPSAVQDDSISEKEHRQDHPDKSDMSNTGAAHSMNIERESDDMHSAADRTRHNPDDRHGAHGSGKADRSDRPGKDEKSKSSGKRYVKGASSGEKSGKSKR